MSRIELKRWIIRLLPCAGAAFAFLALAAAVALKSNAAPADPPQSETWIFDRLDQVNGHKITVLGHPRIIDTPIGKAVEFNGVDDAIYVDVHPLAGAETFTWEAEFRPDGGAEEQRWFHLAEQNPQTGEDTGTRMLFEIRVVNNQWCMDSFTGSVAPTAVALLNRNDLHPLGAWYHVANVYDGKEFRNYINGVQILAREVRLPPQGPGHTSVGVRINKVNYFKGAVHMARFTRRALPPSEFLPVPGGK